jgi:hypothetical protein
MFSLMQTVVKHLKPITETDIMGTTQSLLHAIYNNYGVLKGLQLIYMWIIQILYQICHISKFTSVNLCVPCLCIKDCFILTGQTNQASV